MNPFDEHLEKILAHLNFLNGLLHVLDNHLENLHNLYTQYFKQHELDENTLRTGYTLAIRDLTEWPADRWAVYYPSGNFILEGKEYINIIETFIHRESSWTISQAYEAFVTFLKDITACYLRIHKINKDLVEANLRNYNSYLRKHSKIISHTTFQYWRVFLQRYYRNISSILELLRVIAPNIKDAEQHNNRAIDLTTWFDVTSEVRHAVTHSNLIIKKDRMTNWEPGKKLLLTEYFHGAYTQKDYILHPEKKDAEECLTYFLEYAYTIYKELSTLNNYDWYDVLLKKRS